MLLRHLLAQVGVSLLLQLQLRLQIIFRVGLMDVLGERAILWKEEQRDVESLCMVRLAVFLSDKLGVPKQLFLQNESNLCGNAKVGRRDQDNFLKHSVLGELVSVFNLGIQLLLLHHVEVHHIPNVQIEDPVLRVLDSERVPHIELVALIFLDTDQLLQGRE